MIPNLWSRVDVEFRTPLTILLRKEAWLLLSQEALEVIDIVLSCPAEIYNSAGKITMRRIKFYLHREKRWRWPVIHNRVKELQRFVVKL